MVIIRHIDMIKFELSPNGWLWSKRWPGGLIGNSDLKQSRQYSLLSCRQKSQYSRNVVWHYRLGWAEPGIQTPAICSWSKSQIEFEFRFRLTISQCSCDFDQLHIAGVCLLNTLYYLCTWHFPITMVTCWSWMNMLTLFHHSPDYMIPYC